MRNIFCKLSVVVFAVCAAGALFAQQEPSGEKAPVQRMRLSADEAVELAVKNNLSLESQRVATDIKRRASQYSWNNFLPTVSLSGGLGMTNSSQNAKSGGVEQTTDTTTTAFNGQVQIQLGINFALFEAMKTLKNDYEGGLISLEMAKLQLERDVRKTYYDIILLEEQVEVLRESLSNAAQQAQSAETQYRAGRQPELSYLQAQVNVQTQQPTVDQAANGLKTAKANFAMTLGLPLNTDFELFFPLDEIAYMPLDTVSLVKLAADKKPEILQLKGQLRTLGSRKKATAYQNWTPSLALAWNPALSSAANSATVSPVAPGSKGTTDSDVLTSNGTFSIGLSWKPTSLLPFGPDSQSLKDMDDNIRQLNISLAQMIQGVELEITNQVYSLDQIRESIDASRATAELADRTYNQTLQAYQGGLQNLLQVQTAEQQLRSARLNVYQQESNYIKGLIDLEYSSGVPFRTLMSQGVF
jgi:outer membrane protein TolC